MLLNRVQTEPVVLTNYYTHRKVVYVYTYSAVCGLELSCIIYLYGGDFPFYCSTLTKPVIPQGASLVLGPRYESSGHE